MKNFKSKILSQKSIALGYMEMKFSWPEDCETPKAGQFLTIKIQEQPIPLLRRPFALSAYNQEEKSASIIYQVRGTGTEILSSMKDGETLDVLSPLGNSFTMPKKKETPLLVAGGIGLGPILYFARELDKAGYSPILVFGCRDKSLIPDLPPLKNGRIQFCTDDGSEGFHGSSVDYLNCLDSSELKNAYVYSCGPTGMLKACHNFAVSKNIPSETAMEEMMACGVGACMGCVVELAEGQEKQYARVCKDGPVFQSRIIKWT
ncbi:MULTISPECIES: dihydroorotate dehydrogenase electron transfer subunit [unclassified Oceanispirochaeta]|uniref:dihydroorotate dehydrogenase electron transfer subunit n=1 Tax=unclassified Oceanispirochaeta TaxID=2635722 RepID=UPI000E09BAF4|nr:MULTISPECIES: dihydroorotate dehydrogenase electron transfer subunit [unclassified Oceanispirochaeta]MBF9017084.1 dihydroorotate dehydrogenase electron transfer subunit [Oceanispirochaeta sp. M2]NPD73533.1 dihydroorotate dehydrogenase electron transfer subunit [Oceanispirochaeta sp. M1]RDG30821.1 dihydroorotate dehydrogenase electron transfer subunit [Oceanispirochaeta sp. M1]